MRKQLKKSLDEEFTKKIVEEVTADFERRRKERLPFERQWELNLDFLQGNQFRRIAGNGNVEQDDDGFFWQQRGVFNHIAPLMETRFAKLARINPIISVHPKTDDDTDVEKAEVAEKLISATFSKNKVKEKVKKVTDWSETCGTGFYKIVWDSDGGESLGVLDGKEVKEGEVDVIPVSPFEIFPESVYIEKLENNHSIIHAKAVSVKDIFDKYGVTVLGEKVGVNTLSYDNEQIFLNREEKSVNDSAVIIERYERPSRDFPNGRLIAVCKDKLLYYGDLPYRNGENGDRTFPFIKQDSITVAGSFFGKSIIERLIPVQRAFNAVKNRKHEFLSRLTTGVMTVEDGSIDADELEEDGLCPGKVIVYRQGSKAPEMMDESAISPDFNEEEDKLLQEFVSISGISDVSSSKENARLSSGSALQLLIEQDNERLTLVAEHVRDNYVGIAKQCLRLYYQFIKGVKAIKVRDNFDKIKLYYADKEAIASDDLFISNENELITSPSQKKEMVLTLYKEGLLEDEDGKIRPRIKEKVLEILGHKELDYKRGLSALQEEKASNENEKIRVYGLPVEEIDDDSIHIDEHTRYALSEYDELSDKEKRRIFAHIKEHKERLNQSNLKTEEQ